MLHLAIFASGSGTNAQKLMEYFENHPKIRVALVLSNKPEAQVLQRASHFGIPTYIFDKKTFYESDGILQIMDEYKIDWIVLAGFLWLVPENLLEAFSLKIINLHPALLPKFGGKGMYGMKVHEAVIAAGEKKSGITIHFADKHYDEGNIIFQAECEINETDTPESLAEKIHKLEHHYLPEIVEKTVAGSEL